MTALPLPAREHTTLLVQGALLVGPCRVALGGAPAAWAHATPHSPATSLVTLLGHREVAPGTAVSLEREVRLAHAVAAGARVELVAVGEVLGPEPTPAGVVVPGGPAAHGPYTTPDPAVVSPRAVRWSSVHVTDDDTTLVVTGACGDDEEVAAVEVDAGPELVTVTVRVGTVPAVAEAEAVAREHHRRAPRSLTTHTWALRVPLGSPLRHRAVLDGS